MTSWTIRPAVESDIEETVPFIDNARRSLFENPANADSPIPPDLAKFKDTYITGPGHFVLAHTTTSTPDSESGSGSSSGSSSGELIAGIGYREFDHRFPQLNYKDLKTVEVVRLFVSPDYRRHGLAGKLFSALLNHAKKSGIECMYLHTHKFLPGAITFWERQGFGVVQEEDDPVWQTVHMELKL